MTPAWQTLDGTLPSPQGRAAMGIVGHRIFLGGGNNDSDESVSSKVLVADASSGNLAVFTQMGVLPGPVFDPGGAIANSALIITGGDSSNNTHTRIWPIDADGNLVGATPIEGPALTPGREQHCSVGVTLGGVTRVYVLGGMSGSTLLDTIAVAESMPDGSLGSWVDSGITIGTARRSLDCAAFGQSIYVIGGVDESGTSVSECTRIVLDPTTGMPSEAHAENPLPDGRGFLRVAFAGFRQ